MKKTSSTLITIVLFVRLLSAQDLSVDEILQKANQVSYYHGNDGRAKVQMLIQDEQGRSRKRSFVVLRKNTGANGEQKFYVYFNQPSDMEGMAFLVWKNQEGDDDRWMYYPSLDLVKRIAGGDKRTSFVGSTFLYEDVSGRRLTADQHRLIDQAGNTYTVESTPREKGDVKFTRYISYIDKATFIPMKVEYYNERGKVYRIYEVQKWETVQGNPTVIISGMKDLDTGTTTYNRYSQVEYNIDVDERIFSERYLRSAPMNLINS